MKIEPPKRKFKPKPVALVFSGHRTLRVETVEGTSEFRGARPCYDAIEALDGHTVYTPGRITHLRHTTGARYWQANTWRDRATSMQLDGTNVHVHSLRGALEDSPDPFGDLLALVGWLSCYGVRAAGISAMGFNLWRTTLDSPVTVGARPAVGRGALYGGRQQIRDKRTNPTDPLVYKHMASVDIQGAYPHAMSSAPYALGLRPVSPETTLDPSVPGIAQATVSTDGDLPYGPLPERLAPDLIRFTVGPGIKGLWPWGELAAAVDLGAKVKVERAWAPTVTGQLFGDEWSRRVAEARTLSPGAAKLAKACINATWGMFGMTGDRKGTVRWTDDAGFKPLYVELPPVRLPHAGTSHVAAETASRVRVRMLKEGLYGAWPVPVHVDTDGLIVRKSAVRGLPKTCGPGEWRLKTTMLHCEVRAPQIYRYDCAFCGVEHRPWHYVTAGVPASQAEELFRRIGHRATRVSFNGLDVVLPAAHIHDKQTERAARDEAHALLGVMAQ